ncbi:MAG TPA: FKBP-type peptidyl-prolyl cis-trans isomerase [Glaciihabitans sp.]|nr:FKBP-type peptidyl-prolyl cis-trans isomerase [Glaciihabitans sp.]
MSPVQMKAGVVRKSVAVIVAAGFVAVSAGCSSIPEPTSCDSAFSAGSASNLIAATGATGSAPEVSFPTPVLTQSVQTSVLQEGDGQQLFAGQVADLQLSIYVGETGELLGSTEYDPTNPLRLTVGADDDMIAQSVECMTVGTRAATVLTVEDLYGADQLDPSLGLDNSDTLILVTDVERGYLGRANGELQRLERGFPAVVTAPDGAPGITLPNEAPPTELGITNIRTGDGEVVEEGDQVVVHYLGVLWQDASGDGTVFDSSWDRGAPSTFEAVALSDEQESGLVPGFAEALIGQTVGSQVLAVIPPEFGYPEGQSPASIPEGSTTVFVFDVLGIQ